jgi:hypothetical protein
MKSWLLLGCLAAGPALAAPALAPGAGDGRLAEAGELALTPCVPASEGAYLQVCHRFSTESGTLRCIEAGRDRFYSQCAIDICFRFSSEDGAIQCLEAGRDRAYSTEEMQLCNRFSSEQGAIDCLRASGRDVGSNPRPDDEELLFQARDGVNDALDQLYNGSTRRATTILERLLDVLDGRLGR